MTTVLLKWSSGGDATLLSLEGNVAALCSSVPFAPGSRVYAGIDGFGGIVIAFKIHRSKRTPDGSYRLETRTLDMTKALREQLVSAMKGQ